MSILDGAELPNGLKTAITEIKALLTLNLRIAVYIKAIHVGPLNGPVAPGEGEEIIYHFVRDRRNDHDPLLTGSPMQVNCVLCKSKIGDPLKFCGMTKPFTELSPLFQLPRLTGNNLLFFERTRISVYPFNWYPCFEKDDPKDPRWVEVKRQIPLLAEAASDLEKMETARKLQQRQHEETVKREQEEQEIKKAEEAAKKREESRRKMEELARTLIESALDREREKSKNDNPNSFAADLAKALGGKKK